MLENHFVVRPAEPQDDEAIAALVVEGFMDKFRPVFGHRMARSVKIMERWVSLEHTLGGVCSLVLEGSGPADIVASVGIRAESSHEDALARGLWKVLRRNLGFARACWAATLLSYPRYSATASEAYVERLVVSQEHRHQGLAHVLLDAAEGVARESGKETVGLHVSCDNLPALKLYESYGYEESSRQRSLLTSYFLGIQEWLYLQKEL